MQWVRRILDPRGTEGAALSTEEAIAYAQRGRGERKRPLSGWASLTPPSATSCARDSATTTSPQGFSSHRALCNPGALAHRAYGCRTSGAAGTPGTPATSGAVETSGAAGTSGADDTSGASGTPRKGGIGGGIGGRKGGSAFAVPIPNPTAAKPKPPANIVLAMNRFRFIARLLVSLDVERDCLVNPNLGKSKPKSPRPGWTAPSAPGRSHREH
jgi:hypothetical protein